ncbi:MAG: hypothetical protein E7417_03790 [Ruminococcaceae bacterium]|nr:hypothetical protein [Oscillospiraceae bacterium]
MNSFENIIVSEKCRTMNYGMDAKWDKPRQCPVCGSTCQDYLLRNSCGDIVGCDNCITKFYS